MRIREFAVTIQSRTSQPHLGSHGVVRRPYLDKVSHQKRLRSRGQDRRANPNPRGGVLTCDFAFAKQPGREEGGKEEESLN